MISYKCMLSYQGKELPKMRKTVRNDRTCQEPSIGMDVGLANDGVHDGNRMQCVKTQKVI